MIATHGASLTTVRAQPALAVTETLLAPPVADIVGEVGLRVNVQPPSS